MLANVAVNRIRYGATPGRWFRSLPSQRLSIRRAAGPLRRRLPSELNPSTSDNIEVQLPSKELLMPPNNDTRELSAEVAARVRAGGGNTP